MILGLSPMDGITDCAYRLICQDVFAQRGDAGNQLWTWTEFMNADGYLINPTRLIHHIMKTPDEHKLIAQIYGGKRDALIQCAIDICNKYPDFMGLELNIGCPSPRVMSCGGGSGMLREKAETLETIRLLSEVSSLPFSIKTRAGLTVDDQDEQFDFIVQASQYCHMVGIHGRTYKQSHSGEVNRDMIYRIKQAVGDKCIVLGNGGIKSYEQAIDRCLPLLSGEGSREGGLAQGACDGVMVGQAAIARPWIFTDHHPDLDERFETIVHHLELGTACEIYLREHMNFKTIFPQPTRQALQDIINILPSKDKSGLRVTIEFRKYLFNYITGLAESKAFKQRVATIKDRDELRSAIMEYRERSKEID